MLLATGKKGTELRKNGANLCCIFPVDSAYIRRAIFCGLWVLKKILGGASFCMPEDQDKLRRELTDFIIQRSWECMDGVLSDVLILDALEMAEKYHNLVLVRKSA